MPGPALSLASLISHRYAPSFSHFMLLLIVRVPTLAPGETVAPPTMVVSTPMVPVPPSVAPLVSVSGWVKGVEKGISA